MTSDYVACSRVKSHFLRYKSLPEARQECQIDFKQHWELAESLLRWLVAVERRAGQIARETEAGLGLTADGLGLTSIWPTFVKQLKLVANEYLSIRLSII